MKGIVYRKWRDEELAAMKEYHRSNPKSFKVFKWVAIIIALLIPPTPTGLALWFLIAHILR